MYPYDLERRWLVKPEISGKPSVPPPNCGSANGNAIKPKDRIFDGHGLYPHFREKAHKCILETCAPSATKTRVDGNFCKNTGESLENLNESSRFFQIALATKVLRRGSFSAELRSLSACKRVRGEAVPATSQFIHVATSPRLSSAIAQKINCASAKFFSGLEQPYLTRSPPNQEK